MYLMSCTCIGAGNLTSELCVCLREQNRFHSPFPVIPLTIISEYIVTMFSIRYSSRLAFRHAFSLADFHEDLRNLINNTRNTRFRTNSQTFAVYRNVLPFCAGIFVKNLVIYAIISLNSFKSNVEKHVCFYKLWKWAQVLGYLSTNFYEFGTYSHPNVEESNNQKHRINTMIIHSSQ